MDEEKKEIETPSEVQAEQVPPVESAELPVPPKETSSGLQAFTIPLSIIVAGGLIAGSIIYSNSHQPPAQQNLAGAAAAPVQQELKEVSDKKALEGDAEVLGNPNAPVTVIEFADFQCPFCGKFHMESATKIMETYVKTGKVKFVYRDFPFLGPESSDAAQAAQCARDQKRFWEFHNYLFEHQNGENGGAFSKENLKGFAKAVGLNIQEFGSCLDSGKHADYVNNETQAGRSFGVSGTPTVFINGKPFVGAQPYQTFQSAIDAALAGK